MKVLVACESSGVVREAFRSRGHEAWSCDLLPADDDSTYHVQGDATAILDQGWDLLVAHPPCTDIAVSGAAHFKAKIADGRQQRALDLVRVFMLAPVPRIAVENPISVISSAIRPADQTVQPWMFGHPEQKATCLWLKNLPLLIPTHNVHEEMMRLPVNERQRIHYLPPSENRWKERSKTFRGLAEAMAQQWGSWTAMQEDWIA